MVDDMVWYGVEEGGQPLDRRFLVSMTSLTLAIIAPNIIAPSSMVMIEYARSPVLVA